MLGKNNNYKVLKVFLDSPTEEFGLREISRKCGISTPSVLNYLKEFSKEGLIIKDLKKNLPVYVAKRDNEKFIVYQRISILYELFDCGVEDFLWEKLSPQALILYGSYARGEAVENSDVDIFVIGKEKKINLEKLEMKLGKKIHLMFNSDAGKISKELKNNLVNGIVLKGYFKVLL
jgi:predicted nucleotidyltransferase